MLIIEIRMELPMTNAAILYQERQRKDMGNIRTKNGLKVNPQNSTKNNGSRYYYSLVNP
jgi:hypothetical protein